MEQFEVVDYMDHIWKVQTTSKCIMAPVAEINIKFLYMKVGLNEYVSTEPNPYENE